MHSIRVITIFPLAALLCSAFLGLNACHHRTGEVTLHMLNTALTRANGLAKNDNDQKYREIYSRLADPQSYNSARRWAPSAFHVRTLSESAIAYIDSFGSKKSSQYEFTSQEKSQLFDTLLAYKQNLQSIFNSDSVSLSPQTLTADTLSINRTLPLLRGYSNTNAKEYVSSWIDSIFGSSDPMMTSIALKKVKNDILLSENSIIGYCYKNAQYTTCGFTIAAPIVSQSCIHVKAGQQIDISAGLGLLAAAPPPSISIDGVPTALNDEALAVRTITAAAQPGKHLVPVTIGYTKPDGTSTTMEKILVYYVE